MYFCLSSFAVARLDGWARPWTASNTARRRGAGIQGRGLPVLVSHNIDGPSGTRIHVISSFEVGGGE